MHKYTRRNLNLNIILSRQNEDNQRGEQTENTQDTEVVVGQIAENNQEERGGLAQSLTYFNAFRSDDDLFIPRRS